MKLKFFTFAILITASLLTVSCKKCKVDGVIVDSGEIKTNVVIYPKSGYLTQSMGGNWVIDEDHSYANRFEISINSGDKTPINYANYTLLAFPVKARCNAKYERTVTIDNATEIVTYKMTVTQCSNCPEERYTENYVLVPSFPDDYQVIFDLDMVDKE